jgi:hypothetical protein
MDLAQVTAVAVEAGEPLVYLLATEVGGAAVVISSTGERSCLLFDTLDLDQVAAWRLALDTPDPSDSAQRRGVSLMSDHGGAASEAVHEVIGEIADALSELEDLGHLRLVPTGVLSSLPIAAALARKQGTAATLGVSAQLHHLALNQPRPEFTELTVVANPLPCTAAATSGLGPLSGAQREAQALTEHHKARSHAAMDATKDHLKEALGTDLLALHVSAHGMTNADDPDRGAIFLTDHRSGRPEQLTLGELRHLEVNPWLVFLACCWLGASGHDLPGEAIGFPTILCERGAGAAVAPLWPIGDDDSVAFVLSFYDGLLSGLAPAKALAVAQHLAPAETASTWAAFFATGW